jgi:hypothetical protein
MQSSAPRFKLTHYARRRPVDFELDSRHVTAPPGTARRPASSAIQPPASVTSDSADPACSWWMPRRRSSPVARRSAESAHPRGTRTLPFRLHRCAVDPTPQGHRDGPAAPRVRPAAVHTSQRSGALDRCLLIAFTRRQRCLGGVTVSVGRGSCIAVTGGPMSGPLDVSPRRPRFSAAGAPRIARARRAASVCCFRPTSPREGA